MQTRFDSIAPAGGRSPPNPARIRYANARADGGDGGSVVARGNVIVRLATLNERTQCFALYRPLSSSSLLAPNNTFKSARQSSELRHAAQVPRQAPSMRGASAHALVTQLGACSGCVRPFAGQPGKIMFCRHQPLNSHHAATVAEHAARMRHSLTPSEAALWSALSVNQLGVTFRRQYRVGRFVADFAAPAVRLIVEVDGGYHTRRASADASRDKKLSRLGWRVLRLPSELVLGNLLQAVALVRAELACE